MWILYVLVRLFQLIILLMLSGMLLSVAAISRLMETMIILIYPTAVYLLRQSAGLIILLTILFARMTSSVFHNLCILVKSDQQEVNCQQESLQNIVPLQLNMQTPVVPYQTKNLLEIPKDNLFSKNESPDEGIIEPLQNQSQNNSSTEEATVKDNVND